MTNLHRLRFPVRSPGGARTARVARGRRVSWALACLAALPALLAACAGSRTPDADWPHEGANAASEPVRARLRPAIKYSMIEIEGDARARFELARELGFEGVEIDRPSNEDLSELAAASRATGVEIHGVIDSVHWTTRFSDPDPAVRARAVEALRGALNDAHAVGASTVLVVPGAVRDPKTEGFDAVWARSREAIGSLVPLARSLRVKIAIEVVWNDFLTKPEDLVRYVDSFVEFEPGVPVEERTVAAYFDCSNMIKYGVPPARWIEILGPRLAKVDFKGYSRTRGWVEIGRRRRGLARGPVRARARGLSRVRHGRGGRRRPRAPGRGQGADGPHLRAVTRP